MMLKRFLLTGLVCCLFVGSLAAQDEAESPKYLKLTDRLKQIYDGALPKTVDELKAMEKHQVKLAELL